MASIPVERGTAQWSSRFAFIMAAVGSSVGLGNLWRFSAELGTNGGAAFLVIYLACIIFVGIPLLMSEYIIGRAGTRPQLLDQMMISPCVQVFPNSGAVALGSG